MIRFKGGGFPPLTLNAAAVNRHLDRALRSPLFRNAGRQSRFLRFVVDTALQSPESTIKEFEIGMAVYDRRSDYDPRTDPIVRVEAARLRARLREYYETTPPDIVRIDIPKGRYVPLFISVEGGAAQPSSDLSILVPRSAASVLIQPINIFVTVSPRRFFTSLLRSDDSG